MLLAHKPSGCASGPRLPCLYEALGMAMRPNPCRMLGHRQHASQGSIRGTLLCALASIQSPSTCTVCGVTGRCRVWKENESAGLDCDRLLELRPMGRAEYLPLASARPPGRTEARAHRPYLGPVPGFPLVAAGIVFARLLGFRSRGRITFPL